MLRDGTSQAIPGFQVDGRHKWRGRHAYRRLHQRLAKGTGPFEAARYANAAARHPVTRHGGLSLRPMQNSQFPCWQGVLPCPIITKKRSTPDETAERNEHEQIACTDDGDDRPGVRVSHWRASGRNPRTQLERVRRRRAGPSKPSKGDGAQGHQRLLQLRAGDADQAQDQSWSLRRGA